MANYQQTKTFQAMMEKFSIRRKSIWTGLLAVILGVIVIVLAPKIQEYIRAKKDWNSFVGICYNVLYLGQAKAEFASDNHIGNDVSVTWDDIEPYLNGHNVDPTFTNLAQFNICGEKYILNGRAGFVEAELPRRMCGFASGTRISEAYADVWFELEVIEQAKANDKVSARGYDNWLASFNINPPGISPTAWLKLSIPGYPAGSEISLPKH